MKVVVNESGDEEDKSFKNIRRQRDFIDELKANPIRVRNQLELGKTARFALDK